MQQYLFRRTVPAICISLLFFQGGTRAEQAHEILSGFTDIQKNRPDIIAQNLQDVKDIMGASTKTDQRAAIADNTNYSATQIAGPALGGLQPLNPGIDGTGWQLASREGTPAYAAAGDAKKYYNTLRPFLVDKSIHNLVGAGGSSFPSGHTTNGYMDSLYTAWIFPERYQQIMTRASEYGLHRIVNGVHYPLDTIAGRMLGEWAFAGTMAAGGGLAGAVKNTAENVRAAMLKACGGKTIAACADGGSSDAFGNYTRNRADWESRLTYSLPAVGPGDKPAVVPQGAEYLIMTRFPYLSADQLREVLRTTELPSGIVLDNGEGWARLDLFRAANGYGAIDAGTTVTMDAARAADDTQPGAVYNASDIWSNDIGGRGVLTKAGSGELTLTGHNTFGGLSVSGGTLRLTGINEYSAGVNADSGTLALENGSLQTQGDIITAPGATLRLSGGTLGSQNGDLRITGSTILAGSGEVNVAPGRQGSLSGTVSGPGGLVKSGTGTLSLTGSNSYAGGTHVTAGKLDLGTSSAAGTGTIALDDGTTLDYSDGITVLNPLLLTGAVNLAVDSGEATQAGSISGTGMYALTGTGRLSITGDTSGFSGHTDISQTSVNVTSALGGSVSIRDGGTLAANGPLTSTVDVSRGGTLKGSGSTGSVHVGTGGTVAPGNSPGTLRVLGDLNMDKGSVYSWETDPATGHSDLLSVSGRATLAGGQVLHMGEAGTYSPLATYTILTAAGGVSGQFDGVASDYTFLAPQLGYTSDRVTLRLVRNDVSFASVAQTFNQREAAQAAERFSPLGLLYSSLAVLNAPQMRTALDSLSGETYASSATALAENSRFLREAALDRLREHHGSGVDAWVRPWKSDGSLSGGGPSAGSLDGSASGMMVGVDGGTDWGLRAGVLAGTGSSSWRSGGGSTGSDDQLFGLYAGGQWGPVALRAGAGYSHHDLDTRRNVSFEGFSEQEQAGAHASVMQAFGEAGYVMETGALTAEPYAGITAVKTRLGSFSEIGGEAALQAAGGDQTSTFSTAGLRASWRLKAGRVSVRPYADVAWRHVLSGGTPEREMAFADTGAGFRVRGAPLSADAAVAGAGLELADAGNETSLTLGWNGVYGENGRQENAGNLTLNVAF
ncbi:autotransporter domain-containing protein [Pantoea agglomerans]|uniref:autotransporter domain-containing protein n=1 Tax=Enterobacter agglomerans TaxID=549 RepID=UPI003207E304